MCSWNKNLWADICSDHEKLHLSAAEGKKECWIFEWQITHGTHIMMNHLFLFPLFICKNGGGKACSCFVCFFYTQFQLYRTELWCTYIKLVGGNVHKGKSDKNKSESSGYCYSLCYPDRIKGLLIHVVEPKVEQKYNPDCFLRQRGTLLIHQDIHNSIWQGWANSTCSCSF